MRNHFTDNRVCWCLPVIIPVGTGYVYGHRQHFARWVDL